MPFFGNDYFFHDSIDMAYHEWDLGKSLFGDSPVFSADSQEYAERRVREIYDSGALKSTGELESVIFDVIDVIDD